MNKLISRNPVQRFKQGRKIVKAQFGLHVREDGVVVNAAGTPVYTTNGGYTPTTMTQNTSYQRDFPADVQILPGLYLETETNDVYASRPENEEGNAGYALISKGNKKTTSPFPTLLTKSSNDLDPNKVAKKRAYERGQVTYTQDKNGIWYAKWNNSNLPNQGYYRVAEGSTGYDRFGNHNVLKNGQWIKIEETPAKKSASVKTVTPSYTFGKMGGWKRSIGKGNIDDADSIRYLKEMGLEGKTAAEIQEEINRQLGVKSVKVDNMWGDQSRAGLRALYDYWKLTNTPKAETVTKPSADIKSPSALGSTSYDMKDIIAEPTPQQRAEQEMFNNTQNLTFKRNSNYNKSGIRNLIRNYGLNAYDFSGAQRRALRLYLNGQSNDTSLLTNGLERFIVPYKQGGQLPSRNIVERFKQRNFRLVAQ